MMTEPAVERRDRHYEIRIGDQVAGVAQYADRDNQRIFYHTEIDPPFHGQGLSSTLIRAALDDTRAAGRRIVPVCPAVSRYLKRHDAFEGSVDRVSPELLTWLESVR
jgi:predicted GNAT family acetyltransferase